MTEQRPVRSAYSPASGGVSSRDAPGPDDRTDRGLPVLPEIQAVRHPARKAEAHDCRDGWQGSEDQPRPCPYCRPHLVRRPDGWRVNPNLTRKDQDR